MEKHFGKICFLIFFCYAIKLLSARIIDSETGGGGPKHLYPGEKEVHDQCVKDCEQHASHCSAEFVAYAAASKKQYIPPAPSSKCVDACFNFAMYCTNKDGHEDRMKWIERRNETYGFWLYSQKGCENYCKGTQKWGLDYKGDREKCADRCGKDKTY